MNNSTLARRLTFSGLCLALALVLPFVTGQIPNIGRALSPMHFPVFLCGFAAGPGFGFAVGLVAPLLRSVMFSSPVLFPSAVGMAAELAVYGFACGFIYEKFPTGGSLKNIYITLVAAMLLGRIAWGITRYSLTFIGPVTFDFTAFLAGAFLNAVPGIIAQLVIIPTLVLSLEKAGIIRHARAG